MNADRVGLTRQKNERQWLLTGLHGSAGTAVPPALLLLLMMILDPGSWRG